MRSRRPAAGHFSGLLSVLLCYLLVAAPAVPALQGGRGVSGSKAEGDHPTKGAPGENLPNLDGVKRRGAARPGAQPPVPSTRRKYRQEAPRAGGQGGGRDAREGVGAVSLAAPGGADINPGHSGVNTLPGALAVAAADPYAGVMLASASGGVPPPPSDSLKGPSQPAASSAGGWLSSLGRLFGLGAAVRQTPYGGFENADCNYAWGWAWDQDQPNKPIMVALYSDGQLVATTLADQLRPDITSTTNDDGRHGFRFTIPDSLRDGGSHTLSVQVQGTNYTLGYSPKIISSCVVNYQGAVTSADCDQVTGWAWDSTRWTTPIDVDVYVDGAFAARASADTYNSQLYMGDDKRHQFSVPTPLVARDGQSHTVTLRPAGSAQTLASATTAACTGPNYEGYLDYTDCEVLAGWVADRNRLNTPVSIDIYAGPTFVTRAVADSLRPEVATYLNDNGRHGFIIPVPDSLRDGVPHQLTAVVTGSAFNLYPVVSGIINCSARAGCSAGQALASTEFVKQFYLGSLARQPRPLELQYWNDALRTAAAQGQAPLLAKAKLLGRELFLEGEYAGRGHMAPNQEANYVSDLYWAYLQRGPDSSGQGWWVDQIMTQNAQGQNGWLGALSAFEGAPEFGARGASLCSSPADSVKSYDAVGDFSPLQNPDGAWSYGYRVASTFTPYASRGNIWGNPGTDSWSRDGASCPFITRNNTNSTINYASVVAQPPGLLNLHPGPSGERSTVRWTAPSAGNYLFTGVFQGLDTTGTTTDALVTHNGASIFSGNVTTSQATAFSITRAVAAGDTLEFSVGYGANGNYNNDSTGLSLTVSRQVSTPYADTPAQVPGKVEVELYDAGGESVAYHDTTPASHGQDYTLPSPYPPPAFRQPTDVDLYRHPSYSNGYLTVMQAGDWMNYTTDVAAEGAYTLQARVQWGGGGGGTFHVEADGTDVTGPVQIPDTGYVLQTISRAGVWLPAGHHVLRLVADTNGAGGVTGAIDCLTFAGSQPLVPNAAAFVTQSVPAQMFAGNSYTVSVTFRNTGTKTWTSADNYHLGSQNPQDNLTWGGARASLASPVPPGGEGTYTFTVTAPPTAGTYNFQWRMVQDAVEWFGEFGANQQVVVSPPAPATNVAIGKAATQASTLTNFNPPGDASHAVDGNTNGGYFSGSVTHTLGGGQDWWQVDLGGSYAIQSVRVWNRTDCCADRLTNFYVFVSDTPFAATDLAATLGQAGVSAYYTPGQGGTPTTLAAARTGRYVRVQLASQGVLSLAEVEVMGVPAGGGGADPTGNNYAAARTDPANATGGGDDPLSRNVNFTVPLVSLKGRAGLDLGLGLSYNSLVWTRDAATASVRFDADEGDPSAGFRMGLPVVGRRYRNARGADAYMLVTPSGARVELERTAGTNVFLSTDSSYLQLTEGIFGLSLLATDGTQMTFAPLEAQFVCTRVEDRNGNYLTAGYDGAGRLTSLTDTLGRVVTVRYDGNGRPLAVEQDRSGQTHQWATFGYADLTVNTSFAGVSVYGPANGTVMSVLKWVGLDDGSRVEFLYNTWGQVYRREYHAPDGRLLSYTEYDLQAPTSAQTNNGTDCPRFTQRREFAKDWNNDAPAVTSYSVDQSGAQVVKNNQTLVGGADADTLATVMQKITYGAANTFRRGLVTAVETWGQTTPGQYVLKRTAHTTWTQDDEALTYQLNPRVKVSEVSDPQGNHTGTTVDYTSFGLPAEVREWSVSYANFTQPVEVMQWNGASVYVLRRMHTEYNLDPAYVNRRVIGLVSSTSVYDEAGHVASKVDYTYDQGGELLRHQGEPVQHDGTNYGPTFVVGRGLVTSVRRWDVTALHDITRSVESRAGYNTTGSAIFSRDPLGHQSIIAYTDRFSDKTGTNTLAYPTTATDPDGYASKVEYNFHTGQVSRREDPKGAQQTFTYDAAGRTLRAEVSGRGASANSVISGGYTRWVYSDAMDAVQSWAQVDANMPEVCSISILDGAGRVRATASDLPNSTGGYSARYVSYDIAGRASGQTNPTEVSGLWDPAGDDAARGWKWTTQTFDWKSRPLVTTLPKLLNPGDSGYAAEQPVTRHAEYGGCGCAGSEVVTITDEAGRRQRFTGDPLGRQIKAETLNPNGSVYSTMANTYNGLDQVTEVRHLVGTDGAAQVTTMTYDGHGRLKTRRLPRYATNTAITYEYNADDVVISVTDPRGVVTTYGFTNAANYTNKRHLVNSVSYSNAPSGVPVPSQVRFEYDEVRNRTSMTDGTGSFGYAYNGLSRLTSETRQFSALVGHTYQINYDYTLSGQLKSVGEQGGSSVQYSYDAAGRMLGVTGSGPASAASYASNMKYRAWGALKDVDFGNYTHQFVGYDSRLRAATMELRNVIVNTTNQTPLTMTWNYDYYADNRLDHAYDLQDNRFDRKFDYDEQGRLKEAYTGLEARGQAPTMPPNSPFRQTFDYDAWDNMTGRTGRLWKQTLPGESSEYGTDDRRDGWTYDEAGNLTGSDSNVNIYDAAGSQTYSHDPGNGPCSPYNYEITQDYDGEGRPAHRVQTKRTDTGAAQCATEVQETYSVYSAALGGMKLFELSPSGQKVKGYIYGSGGLLAKQEIYLATNGSEVKWRQTNPGSASWVETASNRVFERQEMDPLGAEVGTFDPFLIVPDPNYTDVHGDAPMFLDGGDPFHLSDGCGDIDGMPASCAEISERMSNGSAIPKSLEAIQGRPGFTFQSLGLGLYRYYVPDAESLKDQTPGDFGKDDDGVVRINSDVRPGRWGLLAIRAFAPQKPAPPPTPTPVLTPTPTPTPDPTKFICITGNWLINQAEVRQSFDKLWDESKKLNQEVGGWMFFEPKTNTVFLERTPTNGDSDSMDDEGAQFEAQVNAYKKEGREMLFIGMYHTHPNGSSSPSSFLGDHDVLVRRSITSDKKAGAPPIGFVIYGAGQYQPYNGAGIILSKNDPKMDQCLEK
jgi:YD repeat-containing protein